MTAAQIELMFKAKADLKRLGPGPDRKALIDALMVGLTSIPPPGNLDVKALKGAPPWLRLRVGDYRILYRPLTPAELAELWGSKTLRELAEQGKPQEMVRLVRERSRRSQQHAETGYLIARIVHRRELERAIRTLS
jgi:mRNA-degrading endonuclease RelE of RelBE toxin-antitoxin system